MSSIRVALGLAAHMNFKVDKLDMKTTFFFMVIWKRKCDASFPGGPIDHHQPAENLCVSYHEIHT